MYGLKLSLYLENALSEGVEKDMNVKRFIKSLGSRDASKILLMRYFDRFRRNAFNNGKCINEKQYEACITRLYHTVEKGLAYENYRAGFGKDNIMTLISTMEEYSKIYGCDAEFYRTAIDVLQQYVRKNLIYDFHNEEIENRIAQLPGKSNEKGGVIEFVPWTEEKLQHTNYKDFVLNRHSIRHFSDETVMVDEIEKAFELAQHTPSACNRQGWKTYIVQDKATIAEVLKYQNGNRGFGQEIDKLLLITADLCYFNKDRELFQAYIDGGMYAMSMLNALHYYRLGTIPLSAALIIEQENAVRKIMRISDSEVFILYIGVGKYPATCQTTRSERHAPYYELR